MTNTRYFFGYNVINGVPYPNKFYEVDGVQVGGTSNTVQKVEINSVDFNMLTLTTLANKYPFSDPTDSN